jgi:hypothetical protein
LCTYLKYNKEKICFYCKEYDPNAKIPKVFSEGQFFAISRNNKDTPKKLETAVQNLLKRNLIEQQDKLKSDIKITNVNEPVPANFQLARSTFEKDMKSLYEFKEKSDITFIVDGKKIYAHKIIVFGRYPVNKKVLKHIFYNNHNKNFEDSNEVVISEVHSYVFETILWWMYTGVILDSKIYGYSSARVPYLEAAEKCHLEPFIAVLNHIEIKREGKIVFGYCW